MNHFSNHTLALLAVFLAGISAAHVRAARSDATQNPASPGQVPEGLTKSDWSGIHAAYDAGQRAFQPTATGWQARNPGQQWTTKFDGHGFVAEPKNGGWQWGLELMSCGYGENQRAIGGTPSVKAEGTRLTCQRDAAVQEWLVNDARGLEHGFTIAERPTGPLNHDPSPFILQLSTRGTLHPRVSADAQSVLFKDAGGATVISYAGLKVWDADGKILPSRFETVSAERGVHAMANSPNESFPQRPDVRAPQDDPGCFRLTVDDRGARYPLTIDPIAQQAYLKPAAVGIEQRNDQFGHSVAISGDTVVVGASNEASSTTGVNSAPNEDAEYSGAAYVFVRSALGWTQQAYLKPAAVGTSQAGDSFGTSVAISGDTVVVGAPGEDSSTTGVNSTPNENAIAFGRYDSGAAYVFVRSAGVWTQQAYLKPAAVGDTQAFDYFGRSVAVSGDTVVVGADGEDSDTTGVNSTPNESSEYGSGAAYVFVRAAGVWTQQAYLKPAAVGTTQQADLFGTSVAVSGDTIVVGAPQEDSSTTGVNSIPNDTGVFNANDSGYRFDSGAAYVFVRSAGVWTQQAYLKPAAVGTTQKEDFFGSSVAVSGDTVVVGAYGEDSSSTGVNSTPDEDALPSPVVGGAGAVYVFTRSAGVWSQEAYLKPAAVGETQAGDVFGYSVAISGDTVAVGAQQEDSSTTGVNSTPNESAESSGAVYVFVRRAGVWTQQAYLKEAVNGPHLFGIAVAVSGDTVIVGAPFENSSSTGVNSTPDDSASGAGAAYAFTGLGPAFAISATVRSGPDLLISFPTMIGKSYTLWRSDTFAPGAWTNTGLTAIPGDDTTKTFTTPAPVAGVPERFYRVQAGPSL